MYDARQIANWFIQRAAKDGGKQLTIMQLLKLVYISHGWHLEMRGKPLFENRIEAWQYGPVIPDVYRDFRGQGVKIERTLDQYSVPDEEQYVRFLEDIYRIYGNLSAMRLSEMTHVQGGPWDTAVKRRGWFTQMDNDVIRQHYVEKRAAAGNA